MAWTTPKTFSAGAVLTAAELNTHLRDNLNERAAAKATAAGEIFYATAPRLSPVSPRAPPVRSDDRGIGSRVAQARIGSLARYHDHHLDQFRQALDIHRGTEVEVSVTASGTLVILFKLRVSNSSEGGFCMLSYSISGDVVQAASDNNAARQDSSAADDVHEATDFDVVSVDGGDYTVTLEGRVDSATGTFTKVDLLVIPI